jgi:hypothetical protein
MLFGEGQPFPQSHQAPHPATAERSPGFAEARGRLPARSFSEGGHSSRGEAPQGQPPARSFSEDAKTRTGLSTGKMVGPEGLEPPTKRL